MSFPSNNNNKSSSSNSLSWLLCEHLSSYRHANSGANKKQPFGGAIPNAGGATNPFNHRLQHVEKLLSQASADHVSLSLFPQQQDHQPSSSTPCGGVSASSSRPTTSTSSTFPVAPSYLQPKYLPTTPSVCAILDHLQYEADILHKKISEVEARIKDASGKIKKSSKTLKKKGIKQAGGSGAKSKKVVASSKGGPARGTKRTANASRSTAQLRHQHPSKNGKGGGKASSAAGGSKKNGSTTATKKKGCGTSSSTTLLQLALQNAARKTTATADAVKQLSIFDIRRGYYSFLYRRQLQGAANYPPPPPLLATTSAATTQACCAEVAAESVATSSSPSSNSFLPAAPSNTHGSSIPKTAVLAGANEEDDATPAATETTGTPTPPQKRTKGPLAALISRDRDLLALKGHPIASMNKMDLERARYLFETTFNCYYSFPATALSSSSEPPPESIQRLLGHSPADIQCARIWQRLDGYEPSHFLGVDALLMYIAGLKDGRVMDAVIRHKSCASSQSAIGGNTSAPASTTTFQDLRQKLHYMDTISIENSNLHRVYGKVSPILFQCLSDKGGSDDGSYYDRLTFDFDIPHRSRTAPNKAAIALFPQPSTTNSQGKKGGGLSMAASKKYFARIQATLTTPVLTTTLAQFPLPTPPISMVPTPPSSQQQQNIIAVESSQSLLPSPAAQLFNDQAVKMAFSLSYFISSLKELLQMCYITTTTVAVSGPATDNTTSTPDTATKKSFALNCQSEAKKCATLLPVQRPLQLSSSITSLSAFADFLTGARSVLPHKHLNALKTAPITSANHQQLRLTPTSTAPVSRLQHGVRRMQAAPSTAAMKPHPKRAVAVRRPAPKKKKGKRVWDDDSSEESSEGQVDAESSSDSSSTSSDDYDEEDSPPRRKLAPKKVATSSGGKKGYVAPSKKVVVGKQQRVAQLTVPSEDAPLISHLLCSKVVSASRSSGGKVKPVPPKPASTATKKVAVVPPKKMKNGGAAKKK